MNILMVIGIKIFIIKMTVSEVIKDINYICLLISIIIFLILKFLKYLLAKESLKIKKSNSVFNSIESPSPK